MLLIGCGDGSLGARLKARQQALVEAIESDRHTAETAQPRLDRVIVGDPSNDAVAVQEPAFDCVLCESLDRFREPAPILASVRKWLKTDGQFIAATANVRHFSVVETLIEGTWSSRQTSSNGHRDGRPLRL